LELLLIPRSKSATEITDFEGKVFGFIEQVFLDEDAKVFFYFISYRPRLKMTDISVSKFRPTPFILGTNTALMFIQGIFFD
jgi:hypothetical protein